MTLLWLNLALVFICAFFARYFSVPVYAGAETPQVKPAKVLVFGALLSLVAVSGLRQNIGDTYVYRRIFAENEFTWEFIKSQDDIGFGILQMLLKTYISTDPQVLIFTAALITNVLIVMVLYKYSRMIELSLFVFITGGWFLVSMNGIRQCLAAAVAFAALKFLIEGKWKSYFLVIILASFFHQSALILLPIYFLARTKAWSKATIALILLSVVTVAAYGQVSQLLFSAIGNTQYGGYEDFAEGGASKLRAAVTAAPLLLAFIGRKRLKEIFPQSDYIINMALLGFVFMVIATQNWIFARISLYFSLYQLILISWLVVLFRKKDQKLIYLAIIVCYLFYYYYENVVTLNILYENHYFAF